MLYASLQDVLIAMERRARNVITDVHSVDAIVWGLYIDHKAHAQNGIRQSFTRTYRTYKNADHVTIGYDAATGTIY